ncbi:hypothetical protein JCM6882_008495 [Rhodosporidiobolus microsporus]
MPAPFLPPELVAAILDFPVLRPADLARCCRASSTFADIARPRLYKEVVLRLLPPAVVHEQADPDLSMQMDDRTEDVLDVLSRSSHLEPLIRGVALTFGAAVDLQRENGACSTRWTTVRALLKRLADELPAVNAIWLPNAQLDATCAALMEEERLQHLTSLALGGVHEEAWKLLNRLGGLKELAVDGPVVPVGADLGPPSFRLFSLVVKGGVAGSPDALAALTVLIESSQNTLRRLDLAISPTQFPHLSLFPSLTHLTLSFRDRLTANDLSETLPSVVAACPSLTHFTLAPKLSLSPDFFHELCLPDGLGAHLPPSLTRLSILDRSAAVVDFVNILDDLSAETNLREIGYFPSHRVWRSANRGAAQREVPEEYDWLRDRCWERGVRLVELD